MGRTSSLTYDQVKDAAQSIIARGGKPTVSALRVELGNQGSFTTIQAHLTTFLADEAAKVPVRMLPPEVESELMKAMMVVWKAADSAAGRDIETMRQNFEDEKLGMASDLSEAQSEIKRLENHLQALQFELKKSNELVSRLESDLSKAAGRNVALFEQNADLLNRLSAKPVKLAVAKPEKPVAEKKRGRPVKVDDSPIDTLTVPLVL